MCSLLTAEPLLRLSEFLLRQLLGVNSALPLLFQFGVGAVSFLSTTNTKTL
jgi:hypothetical protein